MPNNVAKKDRFARTRAAVAAWDAGQEARDALLYAAVTDEDVAAYHAQAAADLAPFTEAFAADTADVNTREQAALVSPEDPWLRALVADPEVAVCEAVKTMWRK